MCLGSQPEGSGFVGYYVRNGHELNTGHSSSLDTWFETWRQLADQTNTHTRVYMCIMQRSEGGYSSCHDNSREKESNQTLMCT